jgi:endonuclease/exonuclease/phosphatase family metal-dependent hydrolase
MRFRQTGLRTTRLLLWWLPLLVCAGVKAAATAGELTVMTWNVENYVAEDRMVDGEYRTEYPKPEKAKAALRQAVRETAPDVLALQEMGPEPYLEELQRDLAADGAAYSYRALLEGPDPKRHVALLSRMPLRVARHAEVRHRGAGVPDLVRRGVLEATVEHGDGEVTLFVVHLKSRHTENPADPSSAGQRLGEAEAVREIVLRRCPRPAEAAFLVLGDFNDGPRSRPVRALLRRGETTISELLPAADAAGDGWTHHYRKMDVFSRVDYILVSPALRPDVVKMWVHDSPAVRVASDHRPVLVRLRRCY